MDPSGNPCPECAQRPCQCGFEDGEQATGLRLVPREAHGTEDEGSMGAPEFAGPRLIREYKGPTVPSVREASRALESLPDSGEDDAVVIRGPGYARRRDWMLLWPLAVAMLAIAAFSTLVLVRGWTL